MLLDMFRNVVIVIGCALFAPIVVGFIIGLIQGIRSEQKPRLRVFFGESGQ